jgi:hypothetical protein
MLFGETVAVYCEDHTEHINTLCGQNVESMVAGPVASETSADLKRASRRYIPEDRSFFRDYMLIEFQTLTLFRKF